MYPTHWDPEATPNPSQEGNFRGADEYLPPSWEGSGVGRSREGRVRGPGLQGVVGRVPPRGGAFEARDRKRSINCFTVGPPVSPISPPPRV